MAILTLRPRRRCDLVLLEAACDRAPEVLGLALLRLRPPSQFERDARNFLHMAVSGVRSTRQFADLAARLGIAGSAPYVTVMAEFDGPTTSAVIEAALRRNGRPTISQMHQERYLAVVALGNAARRARTGVLADLRASTLPAGARLAVGPVARTLDGLARSFHETGALFTLPGIPPHEPVIDAAEFGVERLLLALDRPSVIEEFIDEHLGDLLELDRSRGGGLLETLAAYVHHRGRKTDTAAALHLQRQSLYQRLEKIQKAIGPLPPGSNRLGAILLAVEFEAARRRS